MKDCITIYILLLYDRFEELREHKFNYEFQ